MPVCAHNRILWCWQVPRVLAESGTPKKRVSKPPSNERGVPRTSSGRRRCRVRRRSSRRSSGGGGGGGLVAVVGAVAVL